MKTRKTIYITLLFAAWMFGCAAMQAFDGETLAGRVATIDAAIAASE